MRRRKLNTLHHFDDEDDGTGGGSMDAIGIRLVRSTLIRRARYTNTVDVVRSSLSRSICSSSACRNKQVVDLAPRIVFSGIQPTGVPHLGNYLGALRKWVNLQNAARPNDELFFSVVGLHAMTAHFDPKTLRADRRDMMAALLAVGVDPKRVTLFHQDEVHEHAELAWYLTCLTPVARLRRMVAWKSKYLAMRSQQRAGVDDTFLDESQLMLGLLSYPVLQAADILLYRATHVPVGEDQVQHLELSRDIASIFNRLHDTTFFPLPQHVLTPTKRILSLRDPTQKMSKSAADALSRILLTDDDDVIVRKVKRAITDADPTLTFDPDKRAAVSNLLTLLSALSPGERTPDEWAREINVQASSSNEAAQTGRLLKDAVTEAVIRAIGPIRREILRLKADSGYLQSLEQIGREKARQRAAETMAQVRQMSGLD